MKWYIRAGVHVIEAYHVAVWYVRQYWVPALVVGMLAVLITVVVWLAVQSRPDNCVRTEETRILWVQSGKVLVPITQHKYVCTYNEWR